MLDMLDMLDMFDPSYGISDNTLSKNRKVSRELYIFNIAFTPQAIKDISIRINVNGEAWHTNSERRRIDKRLNKFNGRF